MLLVGLSYLIEMGDVTVDSQNIHMFYMSYRDGGVEGIVWW